MTTTTSTFDVSDDDPEFGAAVVEAPSNCAASARGVTGSVTKSLTGDSV